MVGALSRGRARVHIEVDVFRDNLVKHHPITPPLADVLTQGYKVGRRIVPQVRIARRAIIVPRHSFLDGLFHLVLVDSRDIFDLVEKIA
jgi:hypothetical protein